MNKVLQILISFLIAILLYWGLFGAIGGLTEFLKNYTISKLFEVIFLLVYPFTFGGFFLLGIWVFCYKWLVPALISGLDKHVWVKRVVTIAVCPNKKATYLAIFLWSISLILPAAQWRGSAHFGYEVLVLGVGLGWLNIYGGWAAYSNLFFMSICYSVIVRPDIKINISQIVFMLSAGLSGILFFTKIVGPPPNEVVLKEGAVVWLGAYALLTFAYFQSWWKTRHIEIKP